MKALSTVSITETPHVPAVRAPELARVVDALLAFAHAPHDRRAKIALVLLERQGALDCPSCGTRFHVSGYRETRTAFMVRSVLGCACCSARFVVDEQHTV